MPMTHECARCGRTRKVIPSTTDNPLAQLRDDLGRVDRVELEEIEDDLCVDCVAERNRLEDEVDSLCHALMAAWQQCAGSSRVDQIFWERRAYLIPEYFPEPRVVSDTVHVQTHETYHP